MTDFEEGQWYWDTYGVRVEILAVDGIHTQGDEYVAVVAYRREGRKSVFVRKASDVRGWRLDRPVAVFDEVQYTSSATSGERVGSAGKMIVRYISDHHVVIDTYRDGGVWASERVFPREVFDVDFELK